MPKYSYVAMDQRGKETKGVLEVASQNEAITRVKEMGFFPTKIVEVDKEKPEKKAKGKLPAKPGAKKKKGDIQIKIPGLSGRVIGLYIMSGLGLRAFAGVTVGLGGSLIGIHWSLALSTLALLALTAVLFARSGQAGARPA